MGEKSLLALPSENIIKIHKECKKKGGGKEKKEREKKEDQKTTK